MIRIDDKVNEYMEKMSWQWWKGFDEEAYRKLKQEERDKKIDTVIKYFLSLNNEIKIIFCDDIILHFIVISNK